MAKAVLVMDMPECCNKCRFLGQSIRNDFMCICQTAPIPEWMNTKEEYRIIHVNISVAKPDWCPLRELPEKKESDSFLNEAVKNDCFDGTDSDVAYFNGKDAGWNACIDKIIKQ